ncbi:unnamed protein product [Musa acuminata subsp. burmannicoides]
MGCTTSKQARRDRRRSPSPLARSRSLPRDHKAGVGSNDHVVALTSATLGSFKLDKEAKQSVGDDHGDLKSKLAEAKAWTEKMSKRIPTTPTETPPNEPEAVDALELMAGLEESAAPRFSSATVVDRHSFSFYPIHESNRVLGSTQGTVWSNALAFPSPIWKPAKIEEHAVGIGEFDPEVLSAFRKAMEELSPQHPCLLRSPESRTPSANVIHARISGFQERLDSKKANAKAGQDSELKRWPPGGEGKVVLYFTSLRGVRKTYEDCFLVRMILKGYGLRVDERDVSMDRGFRNELNEMLGADRVAVLLPSVFANGRYAGGVEEVRRIHEDGELSKAFSDCEAASEGGRGGPCDDCGDIRFVICGKCSGSCKVYVEEEEDEEEEEEMEEWEDVGGGFRRCMECNENGIVRCPACC